MTVSTAPTPLSYNGNGSTTAFAITWKYNAKSHVVATLRSSTGTETVWALTTNYTLTDPGDSGTLTAVVAPATGQTLVITLEPPNTQSADLPLGGDFPSTTVEDGLDLCVQRDQKIQSLFDRSLRVPKTDTRTGSNLELPIESSRASKFLAFNSSGDPIASAGTSANLGPVSTFIDTLLDDTTAAVARTTLGAVGLTGNETIAGDKILSGANTHSGNNTFSGANTHSGNNTFSGDNTFSGLIIRAVKNVPHSFMQNLGLAASVVANALTVALKGGDGNNPSSTNQGALAFRSTTATTGTYNLRTITAATSVVLPQGGTLGFTASETGFVYIYLCDNGTSREIGLCKKALFDESGLHNTTAVGIGSDSATVLYTTTALTGVAVRLIGRITIQTGATPGDWSAEDTRIELWTPSMKKTGDIVQTVYAEEGAFITTTTPTPYDDTIPQNTEGVAVTSKAITPTNVINQYHIDGQAFVSPQAAPDVVTLALHDDITGANALKAVAIHLLVSEVDILHVYHEMAVGSNGTRTFSLRAGRAGLNILDINGGGGSRKFGGVANSYLRVKEVQA